MATKRKEGPHLLLRYTISAKVIRANKIKGGVEEMGGRGGGKMDERGGEDEGRDRSKEGEKCHPDPHIPLSP